MSEPRIQSLEELKRRLGTAQEIVVDEKGRLHPPESPEIRDKRVDEKTVVKPTRWFSERFSGGSGMQSGTVHDLKELKRRMEQAEEIMVDEKGRLVRPESQEGKTKQEKGEGTFIKPTRWFDTP